MTDVITAPNVQESGAAYVKIEELLILDVDVVLANIHVSDVDRVMGNIGHYYCCPRTDDTNSR